MTAHPGLPAGCELRSSLTSPFGRKVRMALALAGAQVALRHADTMDPDDDLRRLNPLGKLPCLVLPDGVVLYDSRVILSWLDAVLGLSLWPAAPLARAREDTRAVLADGVTDAALLMVYETRFREPQARSERWMDHQAGKIARALAALARDLPPNGARLRASSLGLAAALDYLDWRQPVSWRDDHPALVDWQEAFNRHHPELAATRFVPDTSATGAAT
ncbi:MAG: glutathione S-transferase family protein [Paracoccus sp. (in: a-proteobacteria)]|uniref:glutathione S-transferase family protein n=1 Tax=Paracoccus sp. TaxID=267 RepID=UPI003918AAFD